MKPTGLTKNDQETLRVYRALVEQRRQGTLPAAASLGGSTLRLPRVRLARDVDLAKADPSCARCHGTGRQGHRVFSDASGEVRVPIVCSCVVDAGGVAPDKLDEILGGSK